MLRGAVSGADEASRWPADGAPLQVVRWSLAGQALHERRRAAGQSHTEFGIADLTYAWRHVEAQIGWSAVLAGWHVEEFEAAPTRPSEPHLEAAALERGICGPEALQTCLRYRRPTVMAYGCRCRQIEQDPVDALRASPQLR